MSELQIAEDAEHLEIAAFLAAKAPDGEVLETHAARIVLAGDRAYKLKKRVRLPFLDFSTRAFRETALRRELDLNLPHAPEIYLALRKVTREASGGLALDGSGEVIDWVLEMRRFDTGALLLEIARRGPLSRDLAERLALLVAEYHMATPARYREDGTTPVHEILEGLADSLRQAAPLKCRPQLAAFHAAAHVAVQRLSPLLNHRAIGGAVRRCHGDLHLGNIVLIENRPVAFDALEFDEKLAETDVFYDLAFLLMDLLRLGDARAANLILNTYVLRAPLGSELDGLATLPLFIALRAAVRCLVSFLRARQCQDAEDEKNADRFLEMALAALHPETPCLVAIGGFSGSGKTTMARNLAPELPSPAGALHLRSDVVRKQLFGVPDHVRLSEDHYTQAVSDHVYEITFSMARRALDQGHSVIVDAVFSKAEERNAIAALAKDHKARFFGLWLEAPADDLISRVEGRRGDASDATGAIVTRQLAQQIGPISWARIPTRGSEEESLARVLEAARNIGILSKSHA